MAISRRAITSLFLNGFIDEAVTGRYLLDGSSRTKTTPVLANCGSDACIGEWTRCPE
jgi:hypothetical protein